MELGRFYFKYFIQWDYNVGFREPATVEKPNGGWWGNPEVSNSRKPLALVPEPSWHESLENAAKEAETFHNTVQSLAEMRVHLRTKLAQGQQRGLAYGIIKGRTSVIEMPATDVKTTIFSSEINLKIIDFHKVLELSNRKKLLILLKVPTSRLTLPT